MLRLQKQTPSPYHTHNEAKFHPELYLPVLSPKTAPGVLVLRREILGGLQRLVPLVNCDSGQSLKQYLFQNNWYSLHRSAPNTTVGIRSATIMVVLVFLV